MPEEQSSNLPHDESLKRVIREALKIKLRETKVNKQKVDLANALISTISEFLESYIVMGYDIDGNPVVIRSAKTIQEREALMSMFIKVFSREYGEYLEDGDDEGGEEDIQ